jgi:predicted MFS family arabinose efflux permease
VRPALPAAVDALAERAFRRVFTAYAISIFGDALVSVALAFAVLGLTGSATDLGLVFAARVAPIVLFVLAGGVIADRVARQRMIIASNLVRCASQGLVGVLLVAGVAHVWEIAALQVVHGAATAFSRPAGTGLIPQVVSPGRLQQANALLLLTQSVAAVAGPAIAGVLVVTVGAGWAIVADALTFALAAALLIGVSPRGEERPPRRSFFSELGEGWREVRRRRWLWVSIADFSLFQFVSLSTFLVLGPVVANDSLGGAAAWALIATAFALGTAAGNVVALRVRVRRPLFVAFLLVLPTAPSLVLLAFEAPVAAIAATEVVGGLAIGYAGALWETTLQQQVPRQALSRVSAYDWLGSTALRPLGFALAGPVASVLGVEATLLGAAALSVLSTLVVLSVRSVRELTSEAKPELAVGTVAG